MSSEEDWLLRPVLEKMCLYESLLDGKVALVDISIMNEALDVRTENAVRLAKVENG